MNKTLRDTIIVGVYWILVLTPFMVLSNPSWLPLPMFVGMSFNQYLSWLVVQSIIVPPLGLIFLKIIRWVESRDDDEEHNLKVGENDES